MDGDALFGHYMAVADASPVPVLMYNFTAMTGVDLEPETVGRLAVHPNIVGIKESGGSVDRIAALVSAVPPTFAVLTGSASTFHAALRAGACGGILALACLLPEACVSLFKLERSGRDDDARALQERLTSMAKLFSGGLGVAGLKAALLLKGTDTGQPRSPLASLSESDKAVLHEALTHFDSSTHEPAA
jgi:dihydrodipicolinate synthase/N-acetylneuraminate lyase